MKNFILIIFLFLFAAVHVSAHRENMYFLKGTIGETQVGMEIYEYGENCIARYFTADNLYDKIMLGNILEGNWFELNESSLEEMDSKKVNGDYLLLNEVKTDYWEGTFKPSEGGELKVVLTRLTLDSIDHPFLEAVRKFNFSPYDAYKTSKVEFEKGKIKKFGKNIAIQKFVDTASEVEWFRLVSLAANAQVDSANLRLTAEHLKYIALKYKFEPRVSSDNFQVSYDIQFLSDQLLSYIIRYHVVAEGGTGTDEITYHTIALSSGKELILDDLFRFDQQANSAFTEGEYKWTQYRYNSFGPKIYGLLQDLYPKKFSGKTDEACKYNELRIWYFPEWYLTKKGLMLISKSPFTNRNCKHKPEGVIPYKLLEPYVVDDAFSFK